jgi:4-amino-4-deoxy-L-arabinose transferase-like glycosyltransferase
MRANQFISSIPNWVWAVVLFALALSVRLLHLTSTDIAGDEPFSIFVAQFEPSFIIEYLSTGNNPPLFELILHYWMNWVGDSDYQLRLLPALFSALTVVPIFFVGTKFFSLQVGLLASALFTFSTWNIRFAHEVRVYSLLSLLTAVSIWFFLSIVNNPKQNGNWIGLAVTWVLMLYSHYVSVYMIGTQILIGVLLVPRENFKKALGLLFALVLAYLPNVLTFANRIDDVVENGGTWVQQQGWGEIYGSINLMLNDRLVVIVLILIMILGVALTKPIRTITLFQVIKPKQTLAIALLFLVPYLTQFFISKLYVPMFIDRYILYTSVPLFLSVALMVNHVWSSIKWSFIGPVVLMVAVIWLGTLNPSNNRQVAKAVAQVKEWKTADAEVVVCPSFMDLTFSYHFEPSWLKERGVIADPKSKLKLRMREAGITATMDTREIGKISSSRVIYFDAAADFSAPNNGILNHLSQNYSLKDSAHFHQIFNVYLFETD